MRLRGKQLDTINAAIQSGGDVGAAIQEVCRHLEEPAKMEAENVLLKDTLRDLVLKLEAVHGHPRFRAVWTLAHNQIGPYDGPTYTEELARANAALGRIPAKFWTCYIDDKYITDIPNPWITGCEILERAGVAGSNRPFVELGATDREVGMAERWSLESSAVRFYTVPNGHF